MRVLCFVLTFAISAIIVMAELKSPADKMKESISNNKIQICRLSLVSYSGSVF